MKTLKPLKMLMAVTLLGSVLGFAQNTPGTASPDANPPVRSASNDHDYGWIGLFGLAGLLGLMRRRDRTAYDAGRSDTRRVA